MAGDEKNRVDPHFRSVFDFIEKYKKKFNNMLIKVKVFPNSKKEEIIKTGEGSFEIKIKAKPIRGEANRAVTSVLASYFKIPSSKLKLIKGFRERNKIYEIVGNKKETVS